MLGPKNGSVGAPGFEPGTSCSQSRRDTGLRYAPKVRRKLLYPALCAQRSDERSKCTPAMTRSGRFFDGRFGKSAAEIRGIEVRIVPESVRCRSARAATRPSISAAHDSPRSP